MVSEYDFGSDQAWLDLEWAMLGSKFNIWDLVNCHSNYGTVSLERQKVIARQPGIKTESQKSDTTEPDAHVIFNAIKQIQNCTDK